MVCRTIFQPTQTFHAATVLVFTLPELAVLQIAEVPPCELQSHSAVPTRSAHLLPQSISVQASWLLCTACTCS